MDNERMPAKVRLTDGLGPANEVQPLVERLRTRPTGDPYLHMMVHEAADELERLRAVLSKANNQAERFERGWYLRGDALQAVVDAEAADTIGIESALLETVKAALKA